MLDLILLEEIVLHYISYIAKEMHSASCISFNYLGALLTHFYHGMVKLV